ncbi:MAG: aminoglycoside phosphotransferase [Gallionellaceae bacterium]|nr:MAG: aminoglycoside phosphotransferase [Gallionellaceae bacterium]
MQRQQQLTEWLSGLYPNEKFTLAPASADASFRRYFRATSADGSTKIVMDAPPQHENCEPFLHIGKLFEDAGTHVPHVYAQDLAQGFLLLSDLGNTTYLQALDAKNARKLYEAATDALLKIQLASKPNELPLYDEALLHRELKLFPEWYIAKHLGVTLSAKQSAKLEECFQRILRNNLAQPCVYVHRDYHSRNLMVSEPNGQAHFPHPNPLPKGEGANEKRGKQAIREADARKSNFQFSPGILDFQDAVYGPITYDLASLFKDAYIKWEEEDIMDWLIRYWEKARKAGLPVREDFGEFYRDYEMMGVQRHIKVLGIFARLYHRDGKDGYLKDMPLVFEYLHRACARYIDLKPLLNLLDELHPQAVQEGYTF